MTSVEKKKSRKPKKNSKKAKGSKKAKEAKNKDSEGEVLERVMDSIEMAGASLDFFEEDAPAVAEPEQNELDAALADGEEITEPIQEASEDMEAAAETEEVMEPDAGGEEVESAMDEHTENMDMLSGEEGIEFVDQTQAFSIIESLLFSTDKPLGIGTFKAVFKGTNYQTKEIKKTLNEMMSVYADASRGVSLEEVNGGWQLRTKVDNMNFLRRLAKSRPFKLSGPALEVLAIIAYKQPLIKHEVDEIRGVESGHLVRALMEKGLVCFQGKSELPGKPMQYGTTKKFLEIFSLRNLRELPSLDEIDQLLPDGIGLEEEDEKLSDVTEKMSEDYEGNYSEGEEELVKIEDTLGAIDTSSEFFEEEKRRQKEKRDRDRARDIREAMDVGEEVEAKDQRWLERYEAKLAEAAAEKEAAEALEAAQEVVEAEGIEAVGEELPESSDIEDTTTGVESIGELIAPGEAIGDELSALTLESEPMEAAEGTDIVDEETMARDEEMESSDEFDPFADTEEEVEA